MSENKKTAVFGIYTTRESVERAAGTLVNIGFSTSDVSVLLPENLGKRPRRRRRARQLARAPVPCLAERLEY